MENLTYQAYLANPAIREQIERDVRRARARAVAMCVAGAMESVARMFRRATSKAAPTLQPSI